MAAGYHEPYEKLSESTLDTSRAVRSLMEELDAIDWYQQRIDVTQDAELRAILTHNRDEEKEHAAMVLEWIRRRDPKMDEYLREYLFTSGPIAKEGPHMHVPVGVTPAPASATAEVPRLTVGRLQGTTG
jgi:uncharacterized protein